MVARTKVSSKGQVVIPKDLRDDLNWLPGTKIEIVERPDGLLLRPARTDRERISLEELIRRVPAHEGPAMPIADISRLSEEALRDALAEREG